MAKTLAIRLICFTVDIISEFQSPSVRGRQIHDSILIVNELVDSSMRDRLLGFIFKVDFYKAFDYVAEIPRLHVDEIQVPVKVENLDQGVHLYCPLCSAIQWLSQGAIPEY